MQQRRSQAITIYGAVSQAITVYGAVRSIETVAGTFWRVEDLEAILGRCVTPSSEVTQFSEQILCVQHDYISTSKLLDVLNTSSDLERDKVRVLIDTVNIYESIRPLN